MPDKKESKAKKSRVTITIDSALLKQIDSSIDGRNIRSRSEAIEIYVKRYFKERNTAVILAGGDPDKLIIKQLDTYRPLVLLGKMTLIEDVISKVRAAGFERIFIIGHTKIISAIFAQHGTFEKLQVDVNYTAEEKSLGTAKTVEKVRNEIKSDFLVLPCDTYFDFNLKSMYEFHLNNDGVGTFAIYSKTTFDSKYKGVVELDGFHIVSHIEKPKKPVSHLVKTMIGFFSPQVFEYIPAGDIAWTIEEQVIDKLVSERALLGYPVAGNWFNIHDHNDLDVLKKYLGVK
ncbi:MAG: sugar phosphate nucleotidyltransferase [Candidatus Odinarchaeota archaeon]